MNEATEILSRWQRKRLDSIHANRVDYGCGPESVTVLAYYWGAGVETPDTSFFRIESAPDRRGKQQKNIEEERLLQDISELLKGRTSFIIAHRLSTIRSCDRIMYIDGKGIVESGSHDELMARRGAYYDLYTSQSA